jgi:hypothetical protein
MLDAAGKPTSLDAERWFIPLADERAVLDRRRGNGVPNPRLFGVDLRARRVHRGPDGAGDGDGDEHCGNNQYEERRLNAVTEADERMASQRADDPTPPSPAKREGFHLIPFNGQGRHPPVDRRADGPVSTETKGRPRVTDRQGLPALTHGTNDPAQPGRTPNSVDQSRWCTSATGAVRRNAVDWPTAAVLIAIVIAVMAVVTTYIAARNPKK